jgi:ribonucleoside-diphosphate reductase alpha chain
MLNKLAELTYFRTYPMTKSDGKKETWDEIIDRVVQMHCRKYPHITEEIVSNFNFVRRKLVLPSMRSLQFGGIAIESCNARIYNCCALAITDFRSFSELTYLLMCGCGVGYSVQLHHISQLPKVKTAEEASPYEQFRILDTKESWADSIRKLLKNPRITFDYSGIRPKGAAISTGGTASGPGPLKRAHEKIRTILLMASGRQLSSVELVDIACHTADMVVVGSVRRSATIALFSNEDADMHKYKQRGFDLEHPQRYRVNITAVLDVNSVSFFDFREVFMNMIQGGTGDPGFMMSNDKELLGNPCFEVSLKSMQFCNLTEVNLPKSIEQDLLKEAVKAATFIGTLQAGYTDFSYIRPKWKQNTEEDALLGISFTGMGLVPNGTIPNGTELAAVAIEENKRVAKLIGINTATRLGVIKPSGTASILLGVSSGVHAAFAPFYIRRVRMDVSSPLAEALVNLVGFVGEPESGELLERDASSSNQIIVSFPVDMQRESARYANAETAVSFLERVKHTHDNWIKPTHISGNNTNNVSATVYYNMEEVDEICMWCFDNRFSYSALSFMAYSDTSSFKQLPLEAIDEQTYITLKNRYEPVLNLLKFEDIDWTGTEDGRKNELSCAGGACLLGE